MILQNQGIRLELDGSGGVVLVNRQTGVQWELDPCTALADGSGFIAPVYGAQRLAQDGDILGEARNHQAVAFERIRVERLGETAAETVLEGPAGRATVRYELTWEGLRVTLVAGRSTVTSCALPGAFRPAGTAAPAVVFAKNQGVWHRGTGPAFSFQAPREGHTGWSMPFVAVVGPKDALLSIAEDEFDARLWVEKAADGRMVAAWLQDPSLGRLRYDRRILYRFVDPDVTAIAKAFRRHVIDRGGFKSWDEKIAERPNVERLFGALMCFIGYCREDGIDYAASFRALKRRGFDRAFVYPTCFDITAYGFLMGGRPPLDISRLAPLLDELGYLATPWTWVEDLPENTSDMLLGPDGKSQLSWKIDEQRWYRACPVRQLLHANQVQDRTPPGHTARHFDVTASLALGECYHPDHPLDRRESASWRRRILRSAIARGTVVSSEGFASHATPDYDIGSVKIPQPVHAHWYTVPLTSLVFHDSCIHDWWEVDNYNNDQMTNIKERAVFPLRHAGHPELQAAQDALAGWPPNVFPFGSQYGWVNGEVWGKSYLYTYTLDHPGVQRALDIALPVAKLHRRIGRQECRECHVAAADGSVQVSTFADGTRVAANYASEPREVAGLGLIPPAAWRCDRDGGAAV
jgi:hypothetical protein